MPALPVAGGPARVTPHGGGAFGLAGVTPSPAGEAAAGLGEVLRAAGDGLRHAHTALERRRRAEQQALATTRLAEGRLYWLQRSSELQARAEPGGVGHTAGLLDEYEGWREREFEAFHDPEIAADMRERLGQPQVALAGEAAAFEQRASLEHRTGLLQQGLDASRRALLLRPELFGEVEADAAAQLERSDLPEHVKARFRQEWGAAMALSAAQGLLERDPGGVLALLDGEGPIPGVLAQLDPDAIPALRKAARAELERRERARLDELAAALDTRIDADPRAALKELLDRPALRAAVEAAEAGGPPQTGLRPAGDPGGDPDAVSPRGARGPNGRAEGDPEAAAEAAVEGLFGDGEALVLPDLAAGFVPAGTDPDQLEAGLLRLREGLEVTAEEIRATIDPEGQAGRLGEQIAAALLEDWRETAAFIGDAEGGFHLLVPTPSGFVRLLEKTGRPRRLGLEQVLAAGKGAGRSAASMSVLPDGSMALL